MLKGLHRRAGSRRIGWTLADQGIASLINFGVAIYAARTVSAGAFGGFALAFSVYLICLGLVRAAVSAPIGIRFSTASRANWRSAVGASSGACLTLGVGISPILVAVGALATGRASVVGECILVLATVLPGLLLHDHWRFAFFARATPSYACWVDLVLLGGCGISFAALSLVGHGEAPLVLLAWGIAAQVSALTGCLLARVRPRPSRSVAWLRRHRDLTPSLVGEFILSGGVTQLVSIGVAAVAGVVAAGALRGAQVLFGPVNVILMAAVATAVPEGARLLRHTPANFPTGMRAVSAVVGLTALAWGALVGGFVPDSMGREILGSTWNDARQVVAPLGVLMATIGAGAGALTGLRVLELPQRSVKARAIGAPFLLIGGLLGAIVAGAPGAVWGQCCPMALLVIAWWVQFTDAEVRRRQGAPTSSP